MKQNYRSAFVLFGLSLGLLSAQAQEKKVLKQEEKVANHSVGLVKLDPTQIKSQGGPISILRDQLQLTEANNFRSLDIQTDKQGFVHKRFQQTYKDVPVEFATPVVHERGGEPVSISGEFYDVKEFNVNPAINRGQAFQNALNHIGASKYLWEFPGASREIDYQKPEGELLILPLFTNEGTELKLAYKFDIYATQPLSRGELYIDAQNGRPLFYNSIIKHASSFGHIGEEPATVRTEAEAKMAFEDMAAGIYVTGSAQTRYSGTRAIETSFNGSNYTLNDSSRKVYTRDALNQAPGSTYPYINNYGEFTDNDNNWTTAEHSTNKDDAALDAHWGAMMTYDYFLGEHSRNSYDGNGAQIRSYVHVDNNYDNAFWNGSVMSYGDGSSNGTEGNGYFDALTSIDVAAHEIGHAVCTFTANLAYQRESGALNEGFSDIWGAAVEHFAKGNGNDLNPDASVWLIGDEIDRRTGSAALRSMSNPTSLGQPDTYGGSYWINPNCGTPTRSNDYCGVHTNSGVLNYWFYLATVGGSGTNDVGDVFAVSGIGMAKAANISYRAESQYLSANSTFANARTATIQAAIDLYGAGGAEEQAVTNAWHAVNVGEAYGGSTGGGNNYCSSQGNNINDEYIGRVQVSNIDNASGATSGYTDFTSVSGDMATGDAYTITITPTWTGTVYSEGYAVWIDYNQNESFDDSGELVYSSAATTATSVSGSFTVPATALEGATRMRVSMKYNGTPTSCETFTYGEVEDYTINIGGSGADTQAPSAPTGLVATNTTDTTTDLSWNASSDNVGVTEYDVYMDGALLGSTAGTNANITGLVAGTTYSFAVRAKDAAGNVSPSSSSINVTTTGGSTGDTEAPSAPTALVASNVTDTTADLSWNASSDNVGVTEYDVYMDGSLLGSTASTGANITGLVAGTSYSFYVTAKDAAGNVSGASNSINVTTTGGSTGGTDTLIASYFETGWDGWADGGSDCARYSGSRSPEGSYSIRLRDNSGVASSMTSPSMNLSGYDNVEISFSLYAYSMENGEDFWVRYNDGSGWQTVAAYAAGTSFNNNTFYTATINLSSAQYNLTTGAQIRFQNDASSNADYVHIDEVVVTGTYGSGFAPNSLVENAGVQGFVGATETEPAFEGDFSIYPNPAVNFADVRVMLDIEDKPINVNLAIYDLKGSVIMSKNYTALSDEVFADRIDVSALNAGVYFVEITSDSGTKEIQKLIKR